VNGSVTLGPQAEHDLLFCLSSTETARIAVEIESLALVQGPIGSCSCPYEVTESIKHFSSPEDKERFADILSSEHLKVAPSVFLVSVGSELQLFRLLLINVEQDDARRKGTGSDESSKLYSFEKCFGS
jgi:hypothetical protein